MKAEFSVHIGSRHIGDLHPRGAVWQFKPAPESPGKDHPSQGQLKDLCRAAVYLLGEPAAVSCNCNHFKLQKIAQ